jgi:hypothetical protein
MGYAKSSIKKGAIFLSAARSQMPKVFLCISREGFRNGDSGLKASQFNSSYYVLPQ